MDTTMRWALVLAGACVVTGCATGGTSKASQREAASLARYEAAAGEPVRSFRYFRLDNFVVLGEDTLAVWSNPRQAWLLTVDAPCPGLRWSMTLGMTSSFNRVYAGADAIQVEQSRCRIRSIRPVDVAALRGSEREAGDVATSAPAGRAGQVSGGT
jgi:hypothetical protein